MASFWSLAATALACAGTVVADVRTFNNLNDFTALTNSSGGFPSQKFRSSNIVAPVFQVNSFNEDEVDDAPYIFLGTVYGKMNAGPMILDARDLSLVYADQNYDNTYSSSVQYIGDTPYLTFWEGFHTRGHANGWCLIFDQDYNLKYNITANGLDGALADMHELSFTPDGNIIYSTYVNIPFNLTSVGGPEETLLMDSGFQEVDPDTKEILFDWHCSEHFDVTDSFATYGHGYGMSNTSGWDFAHINSIQKTVDNNYLVSSRHLSMLTLINGTDGTPVWILGGKNNQFTDLSDGQATNFGWQHDARFYKNQSHITMFDNHGEHTGPCEDKCNTRGLHLEIDTEAMTARIVQEYYHPEKINTGAMGGFQALPSGNVILGWGYNPSITEYKSDGTPVLDAQRGAIGRGFLADMFSYRVEKHHWKGSPSWAPSIAVDNPEQTTKNAKAFVSWNGATEVASWVILATDNPDEINNPNNIIAESPRTGFETEIFLEGDHNFQYIAAAAVDINRQVIGSTHIVAMTTGRGFLTKSGITSIEPSKIEEKPPVEDSQVEEHEDLKEHPETEIEDVAEVQAEDSEDDTEDDDETQSGEQDELDDESREPTTGLGNVGAIGGGLFIFALLSYGGLHFWRRRHRLQEAEKGEYAQVNMEAAQ